VIGDAVSDVRWSVGPLVIVVGVPVIVTIVGMLEDAAAAVGVEVAVAVAVAFAPGGV